MKRFFLGLLVPFLTATPLLAQPDERVQRWVEKIISEPEFGGTGNKQVSMWVKPEPTMSVFGANDEQTRVVAAAVAHINESLAKTPLKGIKLLKPNDESAEIRMTWCQLAEMPEVAKKLGFRYVQGNWGFFSYWYNGQREHYKAHILMASDKLQGKWIRHFAIEETIQVLGLVNDSDEFPDSVFYEKGGVTGDAQNFSELDKKLIVFFFNHIKPGDKPADIRGKLAKHWGKDDGIIGKPPEASWLEEVALGSQFGGQGKVISRYVSSPKLSVFTGNDEQVRLAKACVDHLNLALAKTPIKGIEFAGPKDEAANIHVYFAPAKDLPAIAEKYNFKYPDNSAGLFWSFWNQRKEMTRTIILLATDRLEGKALHHSLLQQMVRGLGPMNHSQRDDSSIFYLRGGKEGPTELSEKDKKLLHFFFNYLSPGDKADQVRDAMQRLWRE